jgi:hypothetical protein
MNLHPLSLSLIGRRDIVDFRKGTIALVKVNSIAHNKDVIDLSSQVINFNLNFSPGLLIQKGTDLTDRGLARIKRSLETGGFDRCQRYPRR